MKTRLPGAVKRSIVHLSRLSGVSHQHQIGRDAQYVVSVPGLVHGANVSSRGSWRATLSRAPRPQGAQRGGQSSPASEKNEHQHHGGEGQHLDHIGRQVYPQHL
ncbi:hypothetical protein SGGMMB4_03913 [Sodalis glossinidius str. 'morsitans']|uniref:Uncharacterized protein n=1 Tax=Sodalis glossinidius (strain morsitans) TaxID=343509 RepID=A0A193QKY3_SODGM|nr:hypothetical protein SGGMMB4_03913 [Sodalis glossinidius str. 'morsitans']